MVGRVLMQYIRIKRNIKLIILLALLNVPVLIISILGYELLGAFFGIIILALFGLLLYQELDLLHTLIAELREVEHQDERFQYARRDLVFV